LPITVRQKDARIQRDGELSDSEDEGMGGRKHRQNHSESTDKPSSKRKGKSPEKSNGTEKNGTTSPKAQKDEPLVSPTKGTSAAGTPDPEGVLPPAPKGAVVGTGAIVKSGTDGDEDMDADMEA